MAKIKNVTQKKMQDKVTHIKSHTRLKNKCCYKDKIQRLYEEKCCENRTKFCRTCFPCDILFAQNWPRVK